MEKNYAKTGERYFVIAIQPFAFDGFAKVSIIPEKLGNKITKEINKFKKQ